MANLYSLIRNAFIRRLVYVLVALLISFIIGIFSTVKAATYPATILYSTNHTSTSYATPSDAKNAAEQARRNALILANPSTWLWSLDYIKPTTTNATQDIFLMRHKYLRPDGVGAIADTTLNISYVASCPAGATLINGSTPRTATCTDVCTPPQKMVAGVCTTDPCTAKKSTVGRYFLSAPSSADACLQNCAIRPQDGDCGFNPAGVQGCFYTGIFTGAMCPTETTEPPPIDDPALDCIKKGLTYGQVNDITVCVKKGTEGAAPVTSTDKTEVTTKNPDGTTTGETEVKTSTVSDGNVTTTTTTTDKDGKTTEKTETTSKESYCERNPNDRICKSDEQSQGEEEEGEQSTFGGSCAGTFTCTGDAVQCAIAKDQHFRNCQLFNNESDLSTLGQSIVNGTDTTLNPADEANRETVELENMIDEGSNIGGGTFQDKVIPLMGHNITLPFSNLNFVMEILGGLLLAGAYINAGRIVGVR